MPKRSSKKGLDFSQLAKAIVDEATSESTPEEQSEEAEPKKNPAAVALGKLGGAKGGKARAEKLTAERRSEIARKAAQARWKNRS